MDYYDIFEQISLTWNHLAFAYVDLGQNELQEIAEVYQFPTVRLYKKDRTFISFDVG
jgi:hypothetical protein